MMLTLTGTCLICLQIKHSKGKTLAECRENFQCFTFCTHLMDVLCQQRYFGQKENVKRKEMNVEMNLVPSSDRHRHTKMPILTNLYYFIPQIKNKPNQNKKTQGI